MLGDAHPPPPSPYTHTLKHLLHTQTHTITHTQTFIYLHKTQCDSKMNQHTNDSETKRYNCDSKMNQCAYNLVWFKLITLCTKIVKQPNPYPFLLMSMRDPASRTSPGAVPWVSDFCLHANTHSQWHCNSTCIFNKI